MWKTMNVLKFFYGSFDIFIIIMDVLGAMPYHFLQFHDGLLQDVEYSSLCSAVGPCCLSIREI